MKFRSCILSCDSSQFSMDDVNQRDLFQMFTAFVKQYWPQSTGSSDAVSPQEFLQSDEGMSLIFNLHDAARWLTISD